MVNRALKAHKNREDFLDFLERKNISVDLSRGTKLSQVTFKSMAEGSKAFRGDELDIRAYEYKNLDQGHQNTMNASSALNPFASALSKLSKAQDQASRQSQ